MAIKILVVEDDKSLIYMFKSMLKKAGFKVEVAEDGREGLKKVDEFEPDLILLDMVLPIMDGYDFLKNFKPNLNIPIIVVTGLDKDKVEEKTRLLGARAFLSKDDIHLTDLIEKINSVLKSN